MSHASVVRRWFKIERMQVSATIQGVKKEVAQLAASGVSASELMLEMVALLHRRMLKYNWVGFYMLEAGAQPPMLVLVHSRER